MQCPYFETKETLTIIKVAERGRDMFEVLYEYATMVKDSGGIDCLKEDDDVTIETINIKNKLTKCVYLEMDGLEKTLTMEELRDMCSEFDEVDDPDIKIFTTKSTRLIGVA